MSVVAPAPPERGFLWHDGHVINLGVVPGGNYGRGRALRDDGTVAMFGRVPAKGHKFGLTRSAVWSHGVAVDIGVLPDMEETLVWDTNGFITVGECSEPNSDSEAFIFIDGVLRRLSDHVTAEAMFSAVAINALGEILAWGDVGNSTDAMLLRPVGVPVGDVTRNCRVNVDDLLAVINRWNQPHPTADVNGDGVVGIADLLLVIEGWTF